jgi:putative ABC transport system permease protein
MANSKEDYQRTIESAIGYMRLVRKIEPGADNDFEIFSNESLMNQVNDITGPIKIGALAVSLVALLAAGGGVFPLSPSVSVRGPLG